MKPPAEDHDAGYFQPGISQSVHKPPPAFSSPRSPGINESGGSQRLANPKASASKYDTGPALPARPSPRSIDSSQERSTSPTLTSLTHAREDTFENRNIIIRSFAPHIAVYASSDTDELITAKGVDGGLAALLQPLAERVQGKVVVRDSHGVSRAWDDFGIRIYDPEHEAKIYPDSETNVDADPDKERLQARATSEDMADDINIMLERFLDTFPLSLEASNNEPSEFESPGAGHSHISDPFPEYLHILLSSNAMVPYETFSHPVACLIAVSSRSEAPIESLRQLYAMTGRANPGTPAWMGTEYLRYYVLVHDEDNDEIARSTALFDLMKRHFGLHCHLLRLRSSQCVATDDESVELRRCEWPSARQRLAVLHRDADVDDLEAGGNFIFESDASAINSLIRELVTQSIVPFMESRVMAWNDQVASRRRGLGGRFMSMSKRWAGFGSSKSNGPAGGSSGTSSSSSNYNVQLGFYPPETPEAIMRSLADYAVMLRDWRLAHSTYELMRSDFSHDKAWNYHAAANEMTAVTSLLFASPQSRQMPDNIDQSLDAAVYSYLTRCSSPGKAKRCLILATELLFDRGHPLADHAPQWGARMLGVSVLGSLEQSLVTSRVAEYYTSTINESTDSQPSRKRHAAMWNLIAALSWARLQRPTQAKLRLRKAQGSYRNRAKDSFDLPFPSMQPLWNNVSAEAGAGFRHSGSSSNKSSPVDHGSLGTIFNVGREQLDNFVAESGPEIASFGVNNSPQYSIGEGGKHLDTARENDGFE